MKKRRRDRRRLKPLAPAPNQMRAPGGAQWAGWRWIGGLIGVAILLVLGYGAVQKHRPPVRSDFTLAAKTNGPAAAPVQPTNDLDSALNDTSRSGAVTNRETEGQVADLNHQGTQLASAGDFAKAIEIFKQALALNPENENVHYNLALALAKTGDPANAEHEYKEVLRLQPDYPEAHYNYGNLLTHLGRMEEAEAQFKEAVAEMPESAEFNNNLGVLCQRMHQTNEALLSFQKAVQCDTNNADGHYNLAMCYLARKEQERALVELHEVLRIKPGFEPAQRALARVTSKP